ncbi:hypothetical protein [Sporolactobacillus vineae]|uniref:hypothetical protein n=1 Tax=Sporolactobacillus vineae TaxID=444463 RepID=UPI000288E0BA|nr:hypothetical protein [Sporolactobacillus vineae]
MTGLKRLFPFRKRCGLCHKKASGMRKYVSDTGRVIHVCPQCAGYAERRAFRKL